MKRLCTPNMCRFSIMIFRFIPWRMNGLHLVSFSTQLFLDDVAIRERALFNLHMKTCPRSQASFQCLRNHFCINTSRLVMHAHTATWSLRNKHILESWDLRRHLCMPPPPRPRTHESRCYCDRHIWVHNSRGLIHSECWWWW